MYRPSRTIDRHALLAAFELIAVPASVLAATVVLLLGTGLEIGIREAGGAAGANGRVLDVAAAAVALLAALALVSFGALAVVGYRRFFESPDERLDTAAVLLVPALGVAVPTGFVVIVGGSTALPWWLFALVAISAFAFAFRTIALASAPDARRREGLLVGALAGLPAVVAVVAVVDDALWSSESSRALLGAVAGAGIPFERWLLVAVPLLVATGYGLRAVRAGDVGLRDRVRGVATGRRPSIGVGGIGSTGIGAIRSIGVGGIRSIGIGRAFGRFARSASDEPSAPGSAAPPPRSASAPSDSRAASRPATGSESGASAGTPSSAGAAKRGRRSARRRGGKPVVPSSPKSSRHGDSSGRSSTSSKSDRGSSARSKSDRSSSASSKSDRGSSTGSKSDRSSAASSKSDRGSSTSSKSDSSSAASSKGGSGSSTSSKGGSGAGSAAGDGGTASTGSAAESSTEDQSSSDTRIFVDDFDQYGGAETPVETCPDCDEDIPSDGVYTYCPFCGSKL